MRLFKIHATVKFTHPTIKDERDGITGTIISERTPHQNGSGYFKVRFNGKDFQCWEENLHEVTPETPEEHGAHAVTVIQNQADIGANVVNSVTTPVVAKVTKSYTVTFTGLKPATSDKCIAIFDKRIREAVEILRDKGITIELIEEQK